MRRYERHQREASRAAERELLRRGVSQERPVDVFGLIESAGVWLMFQPLRNLYGAYQRIGDAAGIVIHSKHPLALQRYTAAHEYGHHVLGHEPRADNEHDILAYGRFSDPQEAAAQAFAADLIMPLEFVNRLIRLLELPKSADAWKPAHAYVLSLHLQASYLATITQLVALHKISRRTATRLREVRPRDVKQDLAGVRPENPWADVWVLTPEDTVRDLYPSVDDELHLMLPETPSTGYRWEVLAPEDFLEGIDDEFRDANRERIGGTGLRHWRFRVADAGQGRVVARLSRAWESAQAAQAEEVWELHVTERPTGVLNRGLTRDQQRINAELPVAA